MRQGQASMKEQVKGPLQLHQLEPRSYKFDFKVIVTNKKSSAKKVLAFHSGRGAQEKIFAEARRQAQLEYVLVRRTMETSSTAWLPYSRTTRLRCRRVANSKRITLPLAPAGTKTAVSEGLEQASQGGVADRACNLASSPSRLASSRRGGTSPRWTRRRASVKIPSATSGAPAKSAQP
jgi:hypothetical protein